MAIDDRDELLEAGVSGLEALERVQAAQVGRARRIWRATWPVLAATALVFLLWQTVVWLHWRPDYVLPGPGAVLRRLGHDVVNGRLPRALATTMSRAAFGYGIAIVLGTAIGIAVARVRLLRAATGSLIAGLQTMPSIAWFPLAILLFKQSEAAILFVVVLGAAPSVANGLISGVDHVPPLLLRAGRVLGARGVQAYRYVILPAALPYYVAGLKQAWAFAWRSLMAGELLVIIAYKPSIGTELDFARQNADAEGLLAAMLVIFVVGVVVDAAFFSTLERRIRRKRGLLEARA
jgi:NitT/TauT family transport system permease protein